MVPHLLFLGVEVFYTIQNHIKNNLSYPRVISWMMIRIKLAIIVPSLILILRRRVVIKKLLSR
jgi:hypothetical protein